MSTNTKTIKYAEVYAFKRSESSLAVRARLCIILLSIFVSVLSFFVFSKESLRLDEAQSLWQTSKSPIAMLNTVAQDVHVPLYHILLHYWQVMFGNGVEAARLLSMIFFVLMIPALYVLGRKIYSHSVGIFSVILLAVSPFMNWYGNEVRMYSLFALLIILNQYFFTRLFTDTLNKKSNIHGLIWIGYAVTLFIGMFTHYFFAFNVMAQALFYLLYKKYFPKNALKMFMIIALIGIVLFSPWLYFVYNLGGAANTQPALETPTSINIFNTFSQFLFGFQDDHINTIILSLWPLVVLILFMSLRRNQKVMPQTIYLFISLFLPIILTYVLSNEWKPIYLTRYLILSLPSLYLLMSWIISTYTPRVATTIKILIVIMMLSMLGVEAINAETPVKEDYRGASDYIAANATPRDVIVVSAPFTIYPFEYYYHGPVSMKTLPLWNQYEIGPIPEFSSQELSSDIASIKDSHTTLWLLLSYDQGYEEQIRLYFDTHFQRTESVNFSPGLDLYAYKLRYDDTSLPSALRKIKQTGVVSVR